MVSGATYTSLGKGTGVRGADKARWGVRVPGFHEVGAVLDVEIDKRDGTTDWMQVRIIWSGDPHSLGVRFDVYVRREVDVNRIQLVERKVNDWGWKHPGDEVTRWGFSTAADALRGAADHRERKE